MYIKGLFKRIFWLLVESLYGQQLQWRLIYESWFWIIKKLPVKQLEDQNKVLVQCEIWSRSGLYKIKLNKKKSVCRERAAEVGSERYSIFICSVCHLVAIMIGQASDLCLMHVKKRIDLQWKLVISTITTSFLKQKVAWDTNWVFEYPWNHGVLVLVPTIKNFKWICFPETRRKKKIKSV